MTNHSFSTVKGNAPQGFKFYTVHLIDLSHVFHFLLMAFFAAPSRRASSCWPWISSWRNLLPRQLRLELTFVQVALELSPRKHRPLYQALPLFGRGASRPPKTQMTLRLQRYLPNNQKACIAVRRSVRQGDAFLFIGDYEVTFAVIPGFNIRSGLATSIHHRIGRDVFGHASSDPPSCLYGARSHGLRIDIGGKGHTEVSSLTSPMSASSAVVSICILVRSWAIVKSVGAFEACGLPSVLRPRRAKPRCHPRESKS